MKVYHLKRTQTLPISLNEAWSFFSAPENLVAITPRRMGLKILSKSAGEKIHVGQVIHYRIKVLSFWNVRWVTEITHVNEPDFFVDDQRVGPYALWNHQHHFREVEGGVEMTDNIRYAIPLGFIGRLANHLFVDREVNAIFDFRFTALEDYFKKNNSSTRTQA